jgi:hypothetical protein
MGAFEVHDAKTHSSRLLSPTRSKSWVARPILWFATAYTMNQILHELAHALTAYGLGVPSTLFHFYVDLDPVQPTLRDRALIGVAGPVLSLAIGALCWLAYQKIKDSSAELPLVFLWASGLGMFFGNLMSTSFVGDFSNAAVVLGLPMTMRYLASLIGALSLAAVLFLAGRELSRWRLPDARPIHGIFGTIVLPVVIGTATLILMNQPMSGAFMGARAAEALFWIFAVLGALVKRKDLRNRVVSSGLRWADGALFLLAALAVRVMAHGIPFVP